MSVDISENVYFCGSPFIKTPFLQKLAFLCILNEWIPSGLWLGKELVKGLEMLTALLRMKYQEDPNS